MQPTPPTIPPAKPRDADSLQKMRSPEFRPRRSIWPGVLVAAAIAAGLTAVLVSQYYDDRSLGARLDATVAAAGSTVNSGVEGAVQNTANAADRVAGAVGDAAITAAVKTALAADPSLSALKIDVTTKQGAVVLEGPAPDERARQRAEVLATAPTGVARVDNRLVVHGAAAAANTKPANGQHSPAPTPAKPIAPSTAPAVVPPAPAEAAAPAAPTDGPPSPPAAPPAPVQQ